MNCDLDLTAERETLRRVRAMPPMIAAGRSGDVLGAVEAALEKLEKAIAILAAGEGVSAREAE